MKKKKRAISRMCVCAYACAYMCRIERQKAVIFSIEDMENQGLAHTYTHCIERHDRCHTTGIIHIRHTYSHVAATVYFSQCCSAAYSGDDAQHPHVYRVRACVRGPFNASSRQTRLPSRAHRENASHCVSRPDRQMLVNLAITLPVRKNCVPL